MWILFVFALGWLVLLKIESLRLGFYSIPNNARLHGTCKVVKPVSGEGHSSKDKARQEYKPDHHPKVYWRLRRFVGWLHVGYFVSISGFFFVIAGIFVSLGVRDFRDYGLFALWIGALLAVTAAYAAIQKSVWHSEKRAATQTDLLSEVDNLHLVIAFDRPISVSEFSEKFVFVQLVKSGSRVRSTETQMETFVYRDGETTVTFDGKVSLDSVRAKSHEFPDTIPAMLSEVPVQLPVIVGRVVPFSRVSDLGGGTIALVVESTLAKSIVRIQLVANSEIGFQKSLCLLSRTLTAGDWVKGESDSETLLQLDANAKDRWRVNLDAAEWVERKPQADLEPFRKMEGR